MRAFAESIVATVRHPLVILDQDLKIVSANPSFYRAFLLTPEECLGRRWYDLQNGTWNNPQFRTLLEEIIPHDGEISDYEIEQELPDQGRRLLVMNARRVQRADDGLQMVLVSIEDLTVQRMAQAELRRLNQHLERRVAERTRCLEESNYALQVANEELESFCYSVSHDLRTPLRAVDGFSRELLHGYADALDDRGRHYLNRVRAGAQHMGQLIDDLLDLSRVGRSEMHCQMVDLSTLAGNVIQELRQIEPERRVDVLIQPGLLGYCDPKLIHLVLENLIGNAWKFTGKKEQATIEFGRATAIGEIPTFFVADNGAGFDMAFVDKLFGPFQRLHSAHEFPGTGIGLATVRRVIHRHQGEVWAEGVIGDGARVSFTLPEQSPHHATEIDSAG
ncbi:sensor histidine kinase [Planctomicrobium piriforme]|uniref:histidine kinase n=1 Tax=Planctomicrobium piriforme TaxID=1576369 RepID=A0A1I3GKW9_9PLAN|nr:ATP-binding protein [Planctomicrobium piriforme]SFI24109.1 PAS domain S-box-containing protein [Planctomicrobium piriforme]